MGRLKRLPPPIPRAYYARLPLASADDSRVQPPWYRTIPGFRSGRSWKYPVAVLGYALFAAWIATILVNRTSGLLGAAALVVFLLATDTLGLRHRAPLLGSGNHLVAGAAWATLTVLLLAAAALAGGPILFTSSTASQLPLPSIPAIPGRPTPTATESPSPGAPGSIAGHTPTPSPSGQPRAYQPPPAATTPTTPAPPPAAPPPPPPPPPTPTPTPTPAPTPAPTPEPSPTPS